MSITNSHRALWMLANLYAISFHEVADHCSIEEIVFVESLMNQHYGVDQQDLQLSDEEIAKEGQAILMAYGARRSNSRQLL